MDIEIFKSKRNKQYYFHFKADNGEIIAQSEGYKNASDCAGTVESIIESIISANYHVKAEPKAK